jgi:glycosyltransferase involved in cell wall biosynthesis
MRVTQVAPRYLPQTGGVETHVRELAERLVDRGHEVTVVSADAGGDGARRERRAGVRVVRVRGLAPGGAFHLAPGVYRAVRDRPADVVHAHNYHSVPLAFAAAAADAPFVATPHYHGGSADPVRDRLLALYRPVGARALRRADAVLAVSEWERDRLRADLGVEARVVPNGLDVDRFRGADPVRRDRPYLLSVGRLVEYKGVQHAVRALRDLPAYDLVVAGSGPYRDELARVAADVGVEERVEFRGYVPDADLPGLYAGAAALCLLSGFEAYGMTVAESLAAGTPAVVREAGALTEWAGRPDCVGVSDPTPATVAEAVGAAVDLTPTTDGLLTWGAVTDRVVAIYEDLLAADREART